MPKNNRENGKTKKPLKWETLDVITNGQVRIEITGADGDRGRMYSCRLGKDLGEGRTSGFFQPKDLSNLRDALAEAQNWIDCDREEQRQSRGNSMAGRRFA